MRSVRSVPVSLARRVPGVRAFGERRRERRHRSHTECWAPSIQLHLLPNGDVRACCRNPVALGNIAEERLGEIWSGMRRAEMQRQLAAHEFPRGCEGCASEIRLEGRTGSYPSVFDYWTDRLNGGPSVPDWPTRMEFNLSNACNLQCIQCSGELSSAIRIHREGRPALRKVYGDTFFEDLRAFLPHLELANFAGGEPFLAPENFRVWDMMAAETPDLDVIVNTNATQWNRRVEEVLSRLRFGIILSIDGITRSTYESIRVDADFDSVMTNLERFCDYAESVGTRVDINHCLMPQNVHEFADLLLFAEERGIHVNVSVVRIPRVCCLAALPASDLRRIAEDLEDQSSRVLPQLHLNRRTWLTEVARIRTWAEDASSEQPDGGSQRLLMFTRYGSGPTDLAAVEREMSAFAEDGTFHTVTVAIDELVCDVSPSWADVLGFVPDLARRPLEDLQSTLVEHLGTQTDNQVDIGEDRLSGTSRFGGLEARSILVPLRDDLGRAERARLHVAFRRL